MSSDQPAMRPATREVQCGNEAVHGEHEWLLLGAFRSQCPGYVGAVAYVDEPAYSTAEPTSGGTP